MGKMETELRQRARRGEIQQIIVRTIGAVGVLSVALLAPNAIKMFTAFGISVSGRKSDTINAARKKLIAQGILTHTPDGFLTLTKQGEKKFEALTLIDQTKRKPKRWDGKWRVLIFDVREERKSIRSKIRRTLAAVGFVRLQDSVWVYPYNCEDFVALLKADFKVGKDLLYLIVDALENDRWLRNYFNLK